MKGKQLTCLLQIIDYGKNLRKSISVACTIFDVIPETGQSPHHCLESLFSLL